MIVRKRPIILDLTSSGHISSAQVFRDPGVVKAFFDMRLDLRYPRGNGEVVYSLSFITFVFVFTFWLSRYLWRFLGIMPRNAVDSCLLCYLILEGDNSPGLQVFGVGVMGLLFCYHWKKRYVYLWMLNSKAYFVDGLFCKFKLILGGLNHPCSISLITPH